MAFDVLFHYDDDHRWQHWFYYFQQLMPFWFLTCSAMAMSVSGLVSSSSYRDHMMMIFCWCE